jgi:uncharacterized protein DUF4160
MPIISAFFGIVIRMYYKEHEPAHFHAEHAGQQQSSTSMASWSPGKSLLAKRASEFGRGHEGIEPNSTRIGRK